METTDANSTSLVNGNDKIWAMLSHLSILFGVGILLPLVVFLAMRNESAFVSENAREALNFHISIIIYGLGCALLTLVFIGIPLAILLGLGCLVLSIIAAVRSSKGVSYHYPCTLRLVK